MKRFLLFLCLIASMNACNMKPEYNITPSGLEMTKKGKTLRVILYTPEIARVTYLPKADSLAESFMCVLKEPAFKDWESMESGEEIMLLTEAMTVSVSKKTGAVKFFDKEGNEILTETENGRTLQPATVMGEEAYHVQQVFNSPESEALYGLGQHQDRLMNYKGYDLDLWQDNMVAIVPFLLSSRGYGILWDNNSRTRFGSLIDPSEIPASMFTSAAGTIGKLTESFYLNGELIESRETDHILFSDSTEMPEAFRNGQGKKKIEWSGSLKVSESAHYEFVKMADGETLLKIGDRTVIENWIPYWVKAGRGWTDLEAGKDYPFSFSWVSSGQVGKASLLWKKAKTDMQHFSLWSEVGDGIDYYFVYGPSPDKVISGYRQLTGQTPMMPLWSLGLWQCRERYKTAGEMTDVMKKFRSNKIPIDNIVLDWQYWKPDQWGSHRFDETRFPDPAGLVKSIHEEYNARLMISVWPKFYKGTDNFDTLQKHGYLYPKNIEENTADWLGYPFTFYDAFNPGARKMFWDQMNERLFSLGVDAWWMDATEPEMVHHVDPVENASRMHPNYAGTGARYLNAYSLLNSQAVYEGQRSVAPDQRVFILTRSAFAGQQRYSSATWSGDIASRWATLRAQIPGGLNFSASGIPYWTTDIGGFTNDWKSSDPEWQELQVRWFQYGTFCPLFRVHGQFPFREMWEFGGVGSPAYNAQLRSDRLRYRLMPYIYSLAGWVTHLDYTIMRPLIMDFPDDKEVYSLNDQFMFGPSILVNPVTRYLERERSLYLPAGKWYDLWSGSTMEGGKTLTLEAPYDRIPLLIRAGSIIPAGPEIQYTSEKPGAPLDIYVYTGADGSFRLYEDDGLSFGYERGEFSIIHLNWDDSARILTISDRKGTYPGMSDTREFRIVLVAESKKVSLERPPLPDKKVKYSGKEMKIEL